MGAFYRRSHCRRRPESEYDVDIYTIIFLALAVFIFLRLRNVLGQRTGNERPPYDRAARNVVHLRTKYRVADNVLTQHAQCRRSRLIPGLEQDGLDDVHARARGSTASWVRRLRSQLQHVNHRQCFDARQRRLRAGLNYHFGWGN